MKRLLRWCFNLICLFSCLVCLGVSVIWVRSYWIGDMWLWYEEPLTSNIIRVGYGHVQRAWWDVSRMSGLNLLPGYYRQSPDPSYFTNLQIGQTHFAFAGVRYERSYGNYNDYMLAQMHLAWPFALSGLLLGWTPLLRAAVRRRARAGLCPVCGYDLRASPERCPECGAVALTT